LPSGHKAGAIGKYAVNYDHERLVTNAVPTAVDLATFVLTKRMNNSYDFGVRKHA